MPLPIDVIPNTSPPRFRWMVLVDTINGKKEVRHEGMLPASAEGAVLALIRRHKALEAENKALRTSLEVAQAQVNEQELVQDALKKRRN